MDKMITYTIEHYTPGKHGASFYVGTWKHLREWELKHYLQRLRANAYPIWLIIRDTDGVVIAESK
jgi:hypothetical protein